MPKKKRTSTKKTETAKKAPKKKTTVKKSTKKKVAVKKTTKKKAKKEEIEEEEEEEEEPSEEEEEEEEPSEKPARAIRQEVKHGFIPIPKVWPDHLTKYERSRIIGARALQISMGAPILVEELEKIGNPVKVAEKELDFGFLPLTIRRILPDGEIIDVSLLELLRND